MRLPLILTIDTSCDETAVAISRGRRILANVITSQINIHKKWGGVVPHLAKRAHQQKINFVLTTALRRARTTISKLHAIAVTIGPGLAPALEVGIATAKDLAQKHNQPLISLNHMQGHLLAPFALNSQGNGPLKTYSKSTFPLLGLLVSGGHTQLVLVKNLGQYRLLGETLDDAAGEALDKLAKMLHLGYPGGPIIEIMAKKGRPTSVPLPVPMQHSKDLNFSFSGLKTAALYTIQAKKTVSKQFTYDMAASFQASIATSLTTKLSRAIKAHKPKAVLLGGGVISNLFIRNKLRQTIKLYNINTFIPYSKKLLTDNAAMMCLPAFFKYLKKDFVKNPTKLDRQPSLNFSK